MFLVSAGLTLYPLIASRYNERHQSKICADYQAQVEQADAAAIGQTRERAKRYNIALQPGVQEVTAFSNEAMELAAQGYARHLNITGFGIMGYVETAEADVGPAPKLPAPRIQPRAAVPRPDRLSW